MTGRSIFDRAIAIAACTANKQLLACNAFDQVGPGLASARNRTDGTIDFLETDSLTAIVHNGMGFA